MSFTKYPICDTDILVKYGKVDLIEDLFKYYSKINISDAVYQEINYNSDKKLRSNCDFKKVIKKECFEKAYTSVSEKVKNGQVNLIENHKLPKEVGQIVNSILFEEGIIYDTSQNRYEFDNDLGERVSVIYAGVLNIKIILSDDKQTSKLVDRFYGLKAIRLLELLKIMGIKDPEKVAEINALSNEDDPVEAKEILEKYRSTGSLDNILYLGMVERYKKTYKINKKTS